MSNRKITQRELEHPLIKVPFECLNKSFRQFQKHVDKEFSLLEKVVTEVGKKKKPTPKDDACKFIDKLINRLVGVKRKISETDAEDNKQLNTIRVRLNHLEAFPVRPNKPSGPEIEDYQRESRRWNHIRLNRILVDYFLRFGYYKTAEQLADEFDLKDLVDIEVFVASRKVVEGLKNHSCKEALAWCSENKSKLRKLNSNFEFQLRIQEFLELVRKDAKMDAIKYSQKYLIPLYKTNMSEIQRVMATLAFGKNTKVSPYKELFDEKRWDDLIDQFKHSNYLIYSFTSKPLLYITMQAGLSALKTPFAYQPECYNVNDPLCNPKFQALAEDLPFAFHNHSKLVCRITGKLMDANNPPMVLPNGNVYSLAALEDMATKNEGKIKDPKTGEIYKFTELKKAYIM